MRTPLLLALLLAGCGSAGAALPADAVILQGSTVPAMMHQCSRAVPPAGESTWQPDAEAIAALEAALLAALRAGRPSDDNELANAPRGWRRQYVGIVRGGRRMIYGNFFPTDPRANAMMGDRWRREPTIICDGGPVSFGVEYDVAARRFSHIAFNGSLG